MKTASGNGAVVLRRGLAWQVLGRLEEEGIPYCHWKSNEHLVAALYGETDLDVLIDGARLHDAYRVFGAAGCRRARTSAARNEPGLEDFLGHDDVTGRLVHFHVHWRLATGERHLKRFRLPWEHDVLATRVRDDATGCFVASPPVEVTLAAIRAALKLRLRDRVRMALRAVPQSGIHDEITWLMKATSIEEVGDVAARWLGEPGRAAVVAVVVDGPTRRNLAAVRRAVRPVLRDNTAWPRLVAPLVRWRRELAWLQRGVTQRVRARPVLYGRGGPGGGLVVAVIGADGSGKSTVTADLRRWFAPKFDTLPVYFGSGDGPSSMLRAPLRALRRVALGPKQDLHRKTEVTARHRRVAGLARVVWALALAREKDRKLHRAGIARTRGLLVITDRYPQNQMVGTNDGPLLSSWRASPNPLLRRLGRLESRPYERAARQPPDLVLRLNVDVDNARLRRPEHDRSFLARRIDLVSRLSFPNSRLGVVELDATEPYDDVLHRAIRAVLAGM
jgi:thymidylate kinase